MILLNTNVVSELMHPKPDSNVAAWNATFSLSSAPP